MTSDEIQAHIRFQRWVDALASVLPDPPAEVLDVAAGTGYLALAAASGRLVAVDGFWFTGDEDDVPALFAEHYTAGTRAELPFMHLDEPAPILAMLTAAGFVDLAVEPRPDLNLGGGAPYILTATRT